MSLIDIIQAIFGRWRPIPPVVAPPPPVVLPVPPPPGPPLSPDVPGRLLAAHNAVRSRYGLPPFRANAALMATARDHSAWMASHDNMTHMGADGNPWQRMEAHGYAYSAASENVAWNEQGVNEVLAAWMGSPGHRANVLGDYIDYGGSVAYAADGSPYWTSCFGSPK